MVIVECPTGCGRQRKGDYLMCLKCWHKVPSTLRRRVDKTWRQAQTTGKHQHYKAYREAREAAIASVR